MLEDMLHRGPENSNIHTIADDCGAAGVNEINLSPERALQITPEPRATAIPSSKTPVRVWTVFIVILLRNRLPITTPENAATIPVIISGQCSEPMGLFVFAVKNISA